MTSDASSSAAAATVTPASARSPNFPRQGEVHERLAGPHYTLARIGSPAELLRYGVRHPAVGQTIRGKVFLKEVLDLTAMEISWGLLPPHTSLPFLHKHRQNEEVYLFLQGQGQFQVDDAVLPITEGTAIRVAPAGVRCCRNTSDEPLFYIVIQAQSDSLQQWTGTDGVGVPGTPVWPDAAV